MGRHTVQKWVEGKTVRGVDWNANRRVDGQYWETYEITNQSTTADESGCIHYKTEMKVATLSVFN